MKKLLTLLVLAAMLSCTCLPQIPPQTLQVDENCQAILPDYLEFISVREKCEEYVLTQQPLPGTILESGYPYTVTVLAEGPNSDSIEFQVFLIDDGPIEFIIDTALTGQIDAFGLLDVVQQSFKPYISDSIWDTHNLVMISSPDGSHSGGWYHTDYSMITVDSADLVTLGYTTYKLYFTDPVPLPLAINAGGPPLDEWEADQYFTSDRGGPGATLETAPHVYQTERWGDFQYDLPIGNGKFEVELHFAEIYHTDVGERIFSVHIEDSLVIDNYDILSEAAYGEPVVKTFTITSDFDGYLRLNFSTTEDGAKLSGIRVTRTYIADRI